MNLILNKSNDIGIIASLICLVHCIATPFLFVAKLFADSCCKATPTWWTSLDYLFLFIAFFAVYQSAKMTAKKWVRLGLWLSWLVLFMVIINEQIQLYALSENAIFLPTLSLISLHIYNRNFCQCKTEKCCDNNR